jgi:P4 family phage/plasmid primase-like protien
MEIYAKDYLALGYTSIGLTVSYSPENNKKQILFKQLWQNVVPDTYASFFKNTDNGIALLTGEVNDLYVVDCDLLKEKDILLKTACGISVFSDLSKTNELPENTPIQRSASGGMHYFFSLSKSFENGLLSGKNTSKLVVNGIQTSIDTRGEKGCIIVSPTSYTVQDEKRSYSWISPLVPISKLPAMPKWLVTIINATNLPKITKELTISTKSSQASDSRTGMIRRLNTFQHTTQPIVEEQFNAHFQHIYDRENGYDGSFLEKKPCVLCSHTHRANNYMVRQIFEAVYYIKNYSSSCKSGAFNWEDNILLGSVIASPTTDEPYAKMVREIMRSRGIEIIFTQNHGFLCFNGHYWEELHKLTMAREIRTLCGTLLEMLYKNIRIDPIKKADEQEVKDRKKALLDKVFRFKSGRNYIKKAGSVNNIAECYKQLYFDSTAEEKLNINKDILVVKNGVIDLKTGLLREGKESDYTTIMLNIEYTQNTNTPDISAFLASIFNDDQELILYMQKLLGYAMTGHTSEQIWCIFTGEGSNGKSLLMSIIEKLLGPSYYKVAPYEVFFKCDRKTQAGGATAHLSTLKDARICVKEEADPTDALNIELMKMLSGESTITSRGLYEKTFLSFVPTVLPILLCNHKPAFDVDDYAMTRRIVVIPFTNVYVDMNDAKRPYDFRNPRHRIRDNGLRAKLMLDNQQEQLLNWLVQGAVKWYKEGLGEQPQAAKNAFNDYFTENDRLGQFLDNYCEKGSELHVNASEFKRAFDEQNVGTKIQQTELIAMMAKRGFRHTRARRDGVNTNYYMGLKLSC